MASNLQYYFDYLSQPSRALYILLMASGSSFEAKEIDLLKAEHTSEEYKKINRFQKVPAIVDNENGQSFHLAESIGILRYLVAKGKISLHFYSADIKQRARIDEFLSWQHNGIRTSCSLYFRFLWVQTKIFGSPAAEEKVAKYREFMEKDLNSMEHIWLKNTKYLTGDTLTAADVFGACEVEQIRCCGYEIKDKFPKLYKWIGSVRHQLEPHFNKAHQAVYTYELETKSKI